MEGGTIRRPSGGKDRPDPCIPHFRPSSSVCCVIVFLILLLRVPVPLCAQETSSVLTSRESSPVLPVRDSTSLSSTRAVPPGETSPPNPYAGYTRENISPFRHGFSVGLVSAISLSIAIDSYYTWWQDANKPFSFYTEGWFNGPHQGIDKVGHYFGTYATSKIIRNIMLWGGHSPEAALWWAAGIAAFHSLQIEIGDAFSPYGFDYQDMLMGFLGVGYMILQTEVPFMNNFNFKVSYWSKTGFTSPANFVSDYDAMTVWLSANIHNLLPESMGPYWPEFLQVAVGYGVGWKEARREFVIGLDFNLEAFSPCTDNVLLLQRIFNLVHYPSPTLKLTTGKGPLWYGAHLK